MADTYDLTTDAGKVRLLITDTDVAGDHIFSDDEIDAFLTMESSVIFSAAALALETIASSEVLTQKVIKLLDLQTDGASVGRELRMRAGVLRKQAEAGAETFTYAEMVVDDFSFREKTIKDALRDG